MSPNPSIPSGGLADLHRHLDGSLRPATVADMASDLGLSVPVDLQFHAGMGLEAALSRFAFTLSLLQTPSAVARVAAEMCEDAAEEGVTTLEIRFAPQLHEGAPMEEIVDAALEGVAGRAGIILCGLYGEPPSLLARLVEVARDRPGVVGIDLAGGPSPHHEFGMVDYAPAFEAARAAGLGRTVHAGEGREPSEIRMAVEVLHADRIGHGTTLLQAPDLVGLLLERDVTVEACITSNWHVGAIPSVREHPLPAWLKLGVKTAICADNTLLSAVNARDEVTLAATLPGMDPDLLQRAVTSSHRAAFHR